MMVMMSPIKSADNRPERQHHADENQPQIKLNAGGNGGKHFFGVAGEFDPGDGDQPDRFGEQETGEGRQQHIDRCRKPDR